MNEVAIDPTCLIHGKKMSEHHCLYCCLCYESLTPEECSVDESGIRQDICKPCAKAEKERLLHEFREARDSADKFQEIASKLAAQLMICVSVLEEVRTGDDFECECWNVAEEAQKAVEEFERKK